MNISIEEKKCVAVEKTYHFNIKIEQNNYFIIVGTVNIDGNEVVMWQKRGSAHWDCRKRLKTSQKKAIERMIERMFQ